MPPWRFTHFTPEEMVRTQKRFLRRFYWSPGFIGRTLGRVRSLQQFRALVVAGLDVTRFLGGDAVGGDRSS